MCFNTKYILTLILIISLIKNTKVKSANENKAVKFSITNRFKSNLVRKETKIPIGYQNPYEKHNDILHLAKGRTAKNPQRWPKTGVPIFYSNTFTRTEECFIKTAIERISTYSCIPIKLFIADSTCFVNGSMKTCLMSGSTAWSEAKLKENFPDEKLLNDHVIVMGEVDGHCYSSDLGKAGSKQSMNFDPRDCFDVGFGTIAHEFLHVLGYNHEQTRQDRDENIIVETDHIHDYALENFEKSSPDKFIDFGPYDLYSIMHYGAYAWTKSRGLRTITVKNPTEDTDFARIGQRVDLTDRDKTKIRELTGCVGETHQDHLAAVQAIDVGSTFDPEEKNIECWETDDDAK